MSDIRLNNFEALNTDQVLDAERKLLGLKGNGASDGAALCLSGGGIRSAAFCLGVIQALAAHDLLGKFHYLSTVSGGGYIGGWLTRCIAAWNGDIKKTIAELNVFAAPTPGSELSRNRADEPSELNTLRRYTSFLAPDTGFLSADTWAGIMLWLRNTLINWTVFLPLALAVTCLPAFYYVLICWVSAAKAGTYLWVVSVGAGCVGLVSLFIANYNICCDLPSHVLDGPRREGETIGFGFTNKQVWLNVGRWATAWTLLVPLAFAPALHLPQSAGSVHRVFWSDHGICIPKIGGPPAISCSPSIASARNRSSPHPISIELLASLTARSNLSALRPLFTFRYVRSLNVLEILPFLSWITCILAFLVAWKNTVEKHQAIDIRRESMQNITFRTNLVAWILSGLIPAISLYYGAKLAFEKNALFVAILGPLWVLTAEILRSTVYIAVRRQGLFSDLDREWLARVNGVKLRFTMMLTGLSAAAVYLPMVVLDHWHNVYIVLLGFSAGPVAAYLGKLPYTPFRANTRKAPDQWWRRLKWVVAAAAALFAVAMLILLGRLDIVIVASALNKIHRYESRRCAPYILGLAALGLAVLGMALLGFARLIDRRVNLNLFSMHAVYRNRITRAFLGTARIGPNLPTAEHEEERVPDFYTAFDPKDNLRMADAWPKQKDSEDLDEKFLFPVLNVALNRTTGKGTARAERKAEPFTITPLHCGSPALDKWHGAYAETALFAGGDRVTGPDDKQNGITLGTAMTLSGAAVSPNMGYNSSPFAAFLMTLFNVRLGAWLPNPGNKSADASLMNQSGPIHVIPTMLEELSGVSDDTGKYVYLSDGGHFDNLGLYEMLRRRCRHIVVVDAGQDGDYAYFDLGRTLQMAEIDLGIQVRFVGDGQYSLKVGTHPHPDGYAYATISYPKVGQHNAAEGELLYLKPYLDDGAVIDLQAHHRAKNKFPHDDTADQFFTESDFESYRRLGEIIANKMLRRRLSVLNLPQTTPMQDMFNAAKS